MTTDYVLVPREPTEEMLNAARNPVWEFSPDYAPIDLDPKADRSDSAEGIGKAVYKAMLSASPQLQSPMRGGKPFGHVTQITGEEYHTPKCSCGWESGPWAGYQNALNDISKHEKDVEAHRRIAALEAAALSPSPVVSSIPMGVPEIRAAAFEDAAKACDVERDYHRQRGDDQRADAARYCAIRIRALPTGQPK